MRHMIVWNKALWAKGSEIYYSEQSLDDTQKLLDEAMNEPTMREAYEQALLPTLEYSTPAGNRSGVEHASLALYYRQSGVDEPIERLKKLGWMNAHSPMAGFVGRSVYRHPQSKYSILNCERVALAISRPVS